MIAGGDFGGSRRHRILIRIIAASIISMLVFIAGLAVYSSKNEQQYPACSSYSTESDGYKALYLLAERMGYTVNRFEAPSRLLPDGAVLVAAAPFMDMINGKLEKKYLIQWLSRGNTMILIDTDLNWFLYDLGYITPDRSGAGVENGFQTYSCGKGNIVFLSEPDDFSNSGLHNYLNGVRFIEILQRAGKQTILFNEYYHGKISRELTALDLLGPAELAAFVQIILSLAFFLYVRSKRLGKPVPVYEIHKRQENENLFALADIYMKAAANTIVLENYLVGFKKELAKFLGLQELPDKKALVDVVLKNRVLRNFELIKVLEESDRYIEDKRTGTSGLVKLIRKIEKIRREIRI